MTDLDALYRGFRDTYLDHDALTGQLRAWADAFPTLGRLTSLCTTPEGRDQWLLTIGPEPDRVRPAVWVDGNMHAGELCGSSVALQIAEDALRVHLGLPCPLAPHLADIVRGVIVHVLPRMSPDGAEAVLKTGAYVRSFPRHRRAGGAAFWRCADVDGDGLSLVMRRPDPGGEFVESPAFPGLMVLRSLDDVGPFYKIWPEGVIENWDGRHVPNTHFLADNDVDLNRNFPYIWQPDHVQEGAGRFATSEPEARSVVTFACDHPEIFAWMNLHTFGGTFIRPPGDEPDAKMEPADLALYRELEAWALELTGYPMVSGFEEFLYEPETPVYGDLNDFAYRQRGAVALTCELWDLFDQVGFPRTKRFVDRYVQFTRAQIEQLAIWDRDHNKSRVLRPWRKVAHPQLGDVEIGGLDIRVGLSNPPYELLPAICRKHAAYFLRMAALSPRVEVALHREPGRLVATVSNVGYLPTNVLASAKKMTHNPPLWLVAEGATGERRVEIGHLDGWGRGRFDGTDALYYQRSRGDSHRRIVELPLVGEGPVTVTVSGPRTGAITARLA